MTEKKASVDKSLDESLEQMNKRLLSAVGEMSHVNWVVLRKELSMSKEEILSDDGLIKVFTLWVEGDRTPERLNELLNTSDRDLTNALGIDYDALMERAVSASSA